MPTTAGAYQPTSSSTSTTAFLAKFNPNLAGAASLVYCTYLGGTGGDVGTSIAVDGAGNAYLTGYTASTDFPTTADAFQRTNAGGYDVFVAKINPALSGASSLVYSTYLGGSGGDGKEATNLVLSGGLYIFQPNGPGIAVDGNGNAYVTGCTHSADFPITTGAYETSSGIRSGSTGGVAFVTKLNATGSALAYSTFLGTAVTTTQTMPLWARDTETTRIALDAAGDAYVTGMTGSSIYPQLNAIQGKNGGDSDAFVSTLNSTGSGLLFSTYLGGSYSDIGMGIALDASNNTYVAGITGSANFPVTPGAYEGSQPQIFPGFVSAISAVVPANTFSVAGFPSSATAGVAGSLTVTAKDASGNVLTGYTGTVHFTSSDPQAGLPSDYTFTAADQGVHTFTVTLDTAGTQSITATDATKGLTGSESNITVNPAAASTLSIAGYPSPTNAGLAGNFTVTALDSYGNLARGYIGTVGFSSSDGSASLPANYTFTAADAGVHTFSATVNASGSQSLTATDTATGSITGSQTGITVNPAGLPAATISVTGFSSPTTAGTAGTITVTALDANGNVAPSYRGTLYFSSSDAQAGLPANYTFTNTDQGVHTFTATLKTAGSQSITATDTVTSSITGNESGITVTPAAAAQFILSAPSKVTHSVAFSVTLTVEDAYGNVVTGYVGTVHFKSSDSTATLPANYTFKASDAGVHTFVNGVKLKKTGTQTITVTDTANSALTATDSITVN